MMKRIASALLALLILISGLPIRVDATEVGDTVEMPAMENPGTGWEPDEENWVRRGCDLEGHVHTSSCVSSDNILICEVPEGTHIHDQNCGYYEIQYQWVYTGKVTYARTRAPITLKIRNVDPQGNPVVAGTSGAKFYLMNPALGNQATSSTADENGEASFSYALVDDNQARSTLTLYQNVIKEDTDLGKRYKHNATKYTVNIVKRNGDYSVSIPEAEEDGSFDPETGVLTVVNEPRMGMLTVKMDLECPEGANHNGKFTVKVNDEAIALTSENEWKTPMTGLDWGSYTVSLENAEMAMGYELSDVSYTVQTYSGEKTTSQGSGTVTLSENECTAATVTISGKLKMNMPKYVELRAEDSLGNLLGGAQAGIYLRAASTGALEVIDDSDGDGIISIDVEAYIADVAEMLDEGKSRTVYLKQSRAPAGYDLSETVYALTATKSGGKLEYDIPGARVEGDTMVLPFIHEVKSGTVDVNIVFADNVIPESVTTIPVTITGNGTEKELILSAENGWKAQAKLALGTYTIAQKDDAAQAEQYTLVTTYKNQRVNLVNDGDSAVCTITNRYSTASNTLIVRAVDETGVALNNTGLKLVDESGNTIRTFTCNGEDLYLTTLDELARKDESVRYTLLPEDADYSGYNAAKEQYTITVKESKGLVTIRAARDNFLGRVFGAGVTEGSNGEQILAFTYEANRGDFTVKLSLAGDVPSVQTISGKVNGLGQNPLAQTLAFSADNGWQVTMKNVPMGAYSISTEGTAAGYALKDTAFSLSGGTVNSTSGETARVTLDEAAGSATLSITNTYEKESAAIPSTVELSSRDADGNLLPGFKAGIYLSAGSSEALEEIGDDDNDGLIEIDVNAYLEDISAMIKEGKSRTVYLKQSAAPDGYLLSETVYTLTATKVNGELQYEIAGAEMVGNTMKLTFLNAPAATTGKADLVIKMTVSGEGAPAEIPVTVADDKGSENFTLSAANGWTVTRKNLDRASYTITQSAQVEGYILTTEYQVEGGSITDGVLVMAEDAATVTLTIRNTYTAAAEEKIDTLEIYVQDDLGNALPGAAVGLSYGDNDLAQYGIGPFKDKDDGTEDGKIVISNLKAMVDQVGEEYGALLDALGKLKLTLKQSTRPDNVTKDSDSAYEIVVTKTADGIDYGITGVTSVNGKAEIPMVYEVDKGTLTVQAVMNGVPDSLTAIIVTVTGKNTGVQETMTLSRTGEWKSQRMLPVDTYTIEQNAKATGYTLKSVFDPKSKMVSVKKDGSVTCTITNTYTQSGNDDSATTGNLSMTMRFVDENKQNMTKRPERVAVVISGNGKYTEVTFTEKDNWTLSKSLPVGDYTVDVEDSSAKVDGYVFVTDNDKPAEVTVTEDGAALTITNRYTTAGDGNQTDTDKIPGTDIEVDPNGKIKIRTVDSRGQLWGGAKYGLYYGASEIRSFTDYGTGIINVSNPELVMGIYTESLVGYGAPMTLKQTRSPSTADGLAEKVYTVYMVTLENGKLGLEVEGAEVADDGTQIVEFSNTLAQQPTKEPASNTTETESIVIRTQDEAGNALTGAEYCLSQDRNFDEDEDIIYKETNDEGEIIIDDLSNLAQSGENTTWYLMQSRQPENCKLSPDRFLVKLSQKDGTLNVEKDAGLLDFATGGTVEEGDDGQWIVTFTSSQKTTTVNVTCNEVVNWNDCVVMEDAFQNFKQSEYAFIMEWELDGVEQEAKTLTMKAGETASFEPIPSGARYEVQIPQGISAKGTFTKGQRLGTAATDTVDLEAELTYNIISGDDLTLDMLRVDAQTEEPLSDAVYTLKNADGEEMDTYKTRSEGKFLVDAITAPGEYTLTETDTPDGYGKIKKPINVSAAWSFRAGEDARGNAVVFQELEAEVTHSMVKQLENGTYCIGNAQDEGGSNVIIIAAGAAAALAAAGTGAVLLKKRRKSKA